jgi:hypothetical protein
MTDNVLHAALMALFVVLLGASSVVSFRSATQSEEHVATHSAHACRAITSGEYRKPHEADHSSCS